MSIGETIRKLRQEQGLTQERLAEILSISPQAVSRWETNMTMPDISLIAPICNLFNITSDKLLGINIENKQSDIENKVNEEFTIFSVVYCKTPKNSI